MQDSSYSSDYRVTVSTSVMIFDYISFKDLQEEYFYNKIISKCQHPNFKVVTSDKSDICQVIRSKSSAMFQDKENTRGHASWHHTFVP